MVPHSSETHGHDYDMVRVSLSEVCEGRRIVRLIAVKPVSVIH